MGTTQCLHISFRYMAELVDNESSVGILQQGSDTSAGTGKLCILGHLGLVFIWSCFVSCLLFLLFYVSLRNLCSGTCRKIPGFIPFFRNKFPGLGLIFQDSKIHINPYTPTISVLIVCNACHTFQYFLLELNRFPELSRTSSLFPELFSPGKCHRKISGISRFLRTSTSPVQYRPLT